MVGLLLSLAGIGSIAFGCSASSDCAATATCAAATTPSTEGGAGESGIVYTAPPPPANCDPTADPKDAVACIDDGFALFVDGVGGIDMNPGTQQSPLKTINAAMDSAKLAGRIRVYACASGAYDERVTLAAGVTLAGGFDCNTWKYGNQSTRLAPSKAGVALRVSASANRIQITDLEIAALDGVQDSESSIAMVVSGATVDLRRLAITAGKGIQATYVPSQALTDQPASSPAAGAVMAPSPGITCNCNFGLTVGGAGGDGSAADKSGKSGSATPPPNFPDINHPGTGGTSNGTVAGPGSPGSAGDPGKAGAAPASGAVPGSYTDNDGWNPLPASTGNSGWPGVGGGGGGGVTNGSYGGGGGGCGGCGGYGGYAGRGGGSSIALVASNAALALFACTLMGQDAGMGGVGGAAANGNPGALGSPGASTAAAGGTGGPGGGGAGGTGGSGGVSTAIVNQKSTITPDADTKLLFGKSGAGGVGGKLGAGGVNSDYFAQSGASGATGATFTAQAMIEIP